MPSFTPGPWAVRRESAIDYRPNMIVGAEGQSLVAWCAGGGPKRAVMGPEEDANARLIAAAPDHALICWAMCVGAGRWEPFGDGRGEFCMNGLRHVTELDEFGCPRVTASMRDALSKAKGQS